jgi:phytoene synthase
MTARQTGFEKGSAADPLEAGLGLDAAFAACAAALRAGDPDRYAACLFAPAAARGPLFALYAFSLEIASIRERISEPMPGEIRHQWWREVLSCGAARDPGDHPVARALLYLLRRYRLPPEPFLALIEARGFDLYDDPMPTWLDLEGYCGETSSALIRLATLILAGGEEPGSADLCGHAGVAYAITGLLRAFPVHARRSQCYVPHEALIACGVSLEDIHAGRDSEGLRAALAAMRERARDHLAELRRRVHELAPAIRPAFLPLSLVEPYLARMEAPDYRPFETSIAISPLARLFHIGRNAIRARR